MSRIVHPPRPVPAPAITVNLHRAAANWSANRTRAKTLVDWEAWRDRAQAVRADAVAHLPELLDVLTERLEAAGAQVHRAATGSDAVAVVREVCEAHGVPSVVKSKSMLTEEIDLNDGLAAAGIEAVETDLGEYVVQLMGDRPSHILAPAVHLSAGQIAELFGGLAGETIDPQDTGRLVAWARETLRERFLSAHVGVTGVNLAVAQTGTLAMLESEGNIRLSTSLPRVHVALMGIEKVVRDWSGAAHLLEMLPLASHGRRATAYASLVTGPARSGDDGPGELHVVLVDDGRSAMRGTQYEDVLHCIRCGACLYACPVYRQVGGHAYGTTYSGPIGAVLTPVLEGFEDRSGDLAWMSSLCGACSEACPVKIPLDRHLVHLRAGARGHDPQRPEAAFWEAWGRLWSRPSGYRATAATAGRALAPLWSAAARRAGAAGPDPWVARAPFPFSAWTRDRDLPEPASEPFHVRWAKARGTGATSPARRATARPSAPAPAMTAPSPVPAAPPTPAVPLLDLFTAAVTAVDGTVHAVPGLGEARALARELVGPATVARWADAELDGIATAESPAEHADVSLIVADAAVAETGTIAFAHGPGRPRGAALLPARQIALLAAPSLMRTTPEALARWVAEPPASVVLTAGPSRTADIEQRIVRGVHAPGSLDVIVYG